MRSNTAQLAISNAVSYEWIRNIYNIVNPVFLGKTSGNRTQKRKFMLLQNMYAIHPDKWERGSFRKMIGNVALDQKKEVLQKKV
ncbi:MAG: hypothetical protein WAM88_06320 [Nitrososphaeraceae archaeon]